MTDNPAPRARCGEAFWRVHHEAWKRSDLNQREYCESQGIALKALATAGEVQGRASAAGAHVLVSNYCDHLPLYRQSQILARQGIALNRSTLANWVGGASW